MTELHNYRFYMRMLGGFQGDVWGLHGNVYEHPNFPDGQIIMVSTPQEFNDVHRILITASGRRYRLMHPDGDVRDIHKEIQNVITRGYYSSH